MSMVDAKLSLVPGPTGMAPETREVYARDFGSPDVEEEFWRDYTALASGILRVVDSKKGDAVISSGEGMVALWGAMNSVLKPGDSVLCFANGLYGHGFAEMAKSVGCSSITVVEFPTEESLSWPRILARGADPQTREGAIKAQVEAALAKEPKLVTFVHCETPSAVLNDFTGLGCYVHERSESSLLMVDFVSSAGAVPIDFDKNEIDLGLLAPQKVLSGPPALGLTVVSPRAWTVISSVGYEGYDALLPFRTAVSDEVAPYTHNWAAVAATKEAVKLLLDQGLSSVVARHAECSEYCYSPEVTADGLLRPFVAKQHASPTVTAYFLPEGVSFKVFRQALSRHGVTVGGSYGSLHDKVFRLGHMGRQADLVTLKKAVTVIKNAIRELQSS